MKTHVPASSSEPTVVHGDASLRNFFTDADGSAALLDWELWHVGDPIEDLAYCRPDVEQVLPWPDFLAAYHANGGRAQWRADVGEYYGLWASLRNAVLCASCLHGFVHSLNRAPLAFAGIIHYRRLLLDVARRLAAFARRA
jgi:aminoglycoside phosphotransferase (APT) family kinase protein